MIDRKVQKDVDEFLLRKTAQLEKLLKVVTDACEKVKPRLGPNSVSRVYGRASKQGGSPFKSAIKIAHKVQLKRKTDASWGPADVRDVIGITVVVQYPDQIDSFVRAVSEELGRRSVKCVNVEQVRKPGYFATHVDIQSESASHPGLWCELQVKTMLHDAWSAKMHDLNYKPSGRIDSRLDDMMRVIANSLDAIELQSETLRNLITERWRFEDGWRMAARQTMFESMPAWLENPAPKSKEATLLRKSMIASRAVITAGVPEKKLSDFVERTVRLVASSHRHGWPLAAYLGSLRHDDEDHAQFALNTIDEWARRALEAFQLDDECDIKPEELWSAPLACYAVGDIDKAIGLSRHLLEDWTKASPLTREYLSMNLANFLIEQEYFVPAKTQESRSENKAEIEALLSGCPTLKKNDPSAFHDSRGMIIVAFSEDAAEMPNALSLIEKGKTKAKSEVKEIAEAYHRLHSRLAWRRLLELENAS